MVALRGCFWLLFLWILIEAVAARTSVEGCKGFYEVGCTAILARRVNGGELDAVSILSLARTQEPGGKQKEEKSSHVKHAGCFGSDFNHDSSSTKGLIESYVPEK